MIYARIASFQTLSDAHSASGMLAAAHIENNVLSASPGGSVERLSLYYVEVPRRKRSQALELLLDTRFRPTLFSNLLETCRESQFPADDNVLVEEHHYHRQVD